MSEPVAHERLRVARLASGRDLSTIAKQTGAREAWLRAIETGRLADLPAGVYARSALRAYAGAVGLNPDELLKDCEAVLPSVEDPIAALARLNGLRPRAASPAAMPDSTLQGAQSAAVALVTPLSWNAVARSVAAATIDAAFVGGILLLFVAAASMLCRDPVSAVGRDAAPAFALMGALVAAFYFLFFGGLAGATPGEQIARRVPEPTAEVRHMTGRDIVRCAIEAARRDLSGILSLGSQLAIYSAHLMAARASR